MSRCPICNLPMSRCPRRPAIATLMKTTPIALGGAAATIIVWALNALHVEVPPEVAGAFATIAAIVAGKLHLA